MPGGLKNSMYFNKMLLATKERRWNSLQLNTPPEEKQKRDKMVETVYLKAPDDCQATRT